MASDRVNDSGIDVKVVYDAGDLNGWDPAEKLGAPGTYPYTRGIRPDMYRGRLLAYDALEESFRTFKVPRDPDCPACGPNAGEIVIAEYDELCMPHPKEAPPEK